LTQIVFFNEKWSTERVELKKKTKCELIREIQIGLRISRTTLDVEHLIFKNPGSKNRKNNMLLGCTPSELKTDRTPILLIQNSRDSRLSCPNRKKNCVLAQSEHKKNRNFQIRQFEGFSELTNRDPAIRQFSRIKNGMARARCTFR
jgi:hypothetical protein